MCKEVNELREFDDALNQYLKQNFKEDNEINESPNKATYKFIITSIIMNPGGINTIEDALQIEEIGAGEEKNKPLIDVLKSGYRS